MLVCRPAIVPACDKLRFDTLGSFVTVNKQLNDKERVQAALENTHLLGVVEGCLSSTTHQTTKMASLP